MPGPARLEVTLMIVHRDIATTMSGDNLQIAVSIHIGNHYARPGTAHIVGVGFGAIMP